MGNMMGALAQPPREPGQEPHSLLLGSTHRKSNLAPLPCPAHDPTSPTPPHQQGTFQSRGRGAALPTTPSAPGLELADARSPGLSHSQVQSCTLTYQVSSRRESLECFPSEMNLFVFLGREACCAWRQARRNSCTCHGLLCCCRSRTRRQAPGTRVLLGVSGRPWGPHLCGRPPQRAVRPEERAVGAPRVVRKQLPEQGPRPAATPGPRRPAQEDGLQQPSGARQAGPQGAQWERCAQPLAVAQ